MDGQRIDQGNRSQIDAFIVEHWFTREMVVHGECFDLGKAEDFYVENDGAITGLLTYRVFDGTMEILSLDSIHENQGIGMSLLNMAIFEAKALKFRRIMVITTNDNLRALRFYQKRRFDIVALHRNALDLARKLKPEIPKKGIDGIPLRHEFELEFPV